MKFIRDLRDNFKVKQYLVWFVFLNASLGILLQLIRAFLYEERVAALATTFVYFTTQSNFLMAVISILFILGFSNQTWFKNLAFITLVNISMTAIIFHTLIVPYMTNVGVMQQILHTSNPIIYILFYFVVYEHTLSIKKFWIGLVYPIVFLLFVYLFAEPVLGNLLEIASPNFESARYVYPFLDPGQYDQGVADLLIFNLGFLAPVILLFTLFMLFTKIKFEQYIANKKNS